MKDDLLSRALDRAQAAARASSKGVAVPTLAEEPPQPGDVLLHPAQQALPVQWVVVAATPSGAPKVIPADAGSMVGSGDVALAEPSGVGRLSARCRFEQPLFPAALAGARRSGRLSTASLARVERRRSDLAAAKEGSFTEIETDHDPEYEDWLAEVVEPACRRWQELGIAKVVPLPQRAEPTYARLRWAAGIAAVVGLGALTGLWQQTGRVSKLEEAAQRQQAAASEREAEFAAREQELARQIAASERARQATEGKAHEQLAAASEDLRRAREAALIVNPVLVALEPKAAVRGEVEAIALPAQSSHLLLFLPVDQVVGGTLRLELVDGSTGRVLWERNPLERQKGHEISVGVPTALLPTGELVLRLYRRERGKEELIREHRLQLARVKEPRGALP
ncbi:MAG: hypothetical protein ABJC13_08115 [Acidobacteriota bacterium]